MGPQIDIQKFMLLYKMIMNQKIIIDTFSESLPVYIQYHKNQCGMANDVSIC